MKQMNLRASMLCLTTIFAASFVTAQPLPVDLAGNVSGVMPSVRLSELLNISLKSQNGESLGQVQDLVFDPVTGQVQFAVLSTGTSRSSGVGTSTTSGITTAPETRSTAAGGQFVAIPWRLVSSSGQGQYIANVDRSKLQSAPTFSNSSWPTIDAAWMQSVNSHYGLSGTSTGRPGNNSGTRTGIGTGIGNPSTPGSVSAPGRPPIGSPGSLRPTPSTTPNTGTGTGTGTGPSGAGGAGGGGGK